MIEIDGKDGGGQMLRSALSLAMVTGKSMRMINIRGQRNKSGLMRQHLTCVQAAVAISNGSVDGAEMRSTELVFHPGRVQAGNYVFKIGSAGSTTLLLQTLLPALLLADGESCVEVHGGTHNPMAPPIDFLKESFLPQLHKMGAQIDLECQKPGFAPAGGGVIRAKVTPMSRFRPVDWLDRGKLVEKRLDVLLAHVPTSVAEREITSFRRYVDKAQRKDSAMEVVLGKWADNEVVVRQSESSDGSGNTLAAQLTFEHVTERVTTFGQRGVTAESVAQECWKALQRYLGSRATVGVRLADQLLLPMALAGEGALETVSLSNHLKTNMTVLEQFLDVSFVVQEKGDSKVMISCARS